jgi:hypothetical protein
MLGDNSEVEPPDPFPNSEVKRLSADGSVGSPHVRVGHRQAFIRNPGHDVTGVFSLSDNNLVLQYRDLVDLL